MIGASQTVTLHYKRPAYKTNLGLKVQATKPIHNYKTPKYKTNARGLREELFPDIARAVAQTNVCCAHFDDFQQITFISAEIH